MELVQKDSSCNSYSTKRLSLNSTIAMQTMLDLFGQCPLFLEDQRLIERRRRINRLQADKCSTSSSQRSIKRKFRALADDTDTEEQSADWNQYTVIDLDGPPPSTRIRTCADGVTAWSSLRVDLDGPPVSTRIRTCADGVTAWSSSRGSGGGGGGTFRRFAPHPDAAYSVVTPRGGWSDGPESAPGIA